MAVYFFHMRIGDRFDWDEVGVDLPDLDSAKTEALKAIAGFLRDATLSNEAMPGEAIDIVDEQGRVQLSIAFDNLTDHRRAS